jgi:hypothetical protein
MYFFTSPQIKCNCYIVTVNSGLSRIVTSYLGTKHTKNQVVTQKLVLSNMAVTNEKR